jgi:hypothetical protein
MSDQVRDKLEELVNASADGSLTDEQRREFSGILQSDEFRDALAMQKRVDESVGRQSACPDADLVLRGAMSRKTSVPPVRGATYVGRRPIRAIAAGIVLAVLGAGVAWQYWPEANEPLPPPRSLDVVYFDTVKSGFSPTLFCKDDRTFATALYTHLGQALLLSDVPAGVKPLGFGFCNSISPWTTFLLANAGDNHILVFFDRAERDPGQRIPAGSGLYLASHRIDNIVLYEVSTLDKPLLLKHFASKSMPTEWLKREQCAP